MLTRKTTEPVSLLTGESAGLGLAVAMIRQGDSPLPFLFLIKDFEKMWRLERPGMKKSHALLHASGALTCLPPTLQF